MQRGQVHTAVKIYPKKKKKGNKHNLLKKVVLTLTVVSFSISQFLNASVNPKGIPLPQEFILNRYLLT